jgi:hypothetical protein
LVFDAGAFLARMSDQNASNHPKRHQAGKGAASDTSTHPLETKPDLEKECSRQHFRGSNGLCVWARLASPEVPLFRVVRRGVELFFIYSAIESRLLKWQAGAIAEPVR